MRPEAGSTCRQRPTKREEGRRRKGPQKGSALPAQDREQKRQKLKQEGAAAFIGADAAATSSRDAPEEPVRAQVPVGKADSFSLAQCTKQPFKNPGPVLRTLLAAPLANLLL